MFYSTVLSRAKKPLFSKETKKKEKKEKKTKITRKKRRNGSLGEASEATTEWMVGGVRGAP